MENTDIVMFAGDTTVAVAADFRHDEKISICHKKIQGLLWKK